MIPPRGRAEAMRVLPKKVNSDGGESCRVYMGDREMSVTSLFETMIFNDRYEVFGGGLKLSLTGLSQTSIFLALYLLFMEIILAFYLGGDNILRLCCTFFLNYSCVPGNPRTALPLYRNFLFSLYRRLFLTSRTLSRLIFENLTPQTLSIHSANLLLLPYLHR